jgi:hypothetical protein
MARKLQLIWLGLIALAAFLGLCTIFVTVATAIQAWQEHDQARWPEVKAQVDRCALNRKSTGWKNWYHIDCRLSYAVGSERNVARIFSVNVPSPDVWQYPPNRIAPFEKWVNDHPPGTPLLIHYNPAHHAKIVLAEYLPGDGPRTPRNLTLLEVCSGSFLALLALVRIMPRLLRQREPSSMPLNPEAISRKIAP